MLTVGMALPRRSLQRISILPLREQISRVCGDTYRRLLFRGWSRLYLHAASERASAAVVAAARAETLEDVDKHSIASWEAIVDAQQKAGGAKSVLEPRDRRRAKWLVSTTVAD